MVRGKLSFSGNNCYYFILISLLCYIFKLYELMIINRIKVKSKENLSKKNLVLSQTKTLQDRY